MTRFLSFFALLAVDCQTLVNAVVLRQPSKSASKDAEQAVCISIEAYEEPEWIDALIRNVEHFSEPSTRMVFHLNAETNYSDSDIERWNTERITTAKQRVTVKKFHGSVLNGHLLNVNQLLDIWPGVCSHVVLQSSNMLWVRRGMEQEVRKRDYAQIKKVKDPNYHMIGHPFYESLIKPKGFHGWGQPEGSFFPMKTMLDFVKFTEEEYASEGLTGQDRINAISDVECFVEEFWLQSYVLNRADPPPPDEALTGMPICYRGSLTEDSLDIQDVKKVAYESTGICGNGAPWTDFFAVKRIARDLRHPVTNFILHKL